MTLLTVNACLNDFSLGSKSSKREYCYAQGEQPMEQVHHLLVYVLRVLPKALMLQLQYNIEKA